MDYAKCDYFPQDVIECWDDKSKCAFCGWNPEVRAARNEQMRNGLVETVGTICNRGRVRGYYPARGIRVRTKPNDVIGESDSP